MTSIDTEQFRHALLEEKQRVEHALATLRDEHSGSLDDEVDEVAAASDNHLAETASATLGREIDYTLGDNAEQVLSEIDAALGRIDDAMTSLERAYEDRVSDFARVKLLPWPDEVRAHPRFVALLQKLVVA